MSALAIQVGTIGSGRTLVPPAPSPWPPESLLESRVGCFGEEGHLPGSTRLCRGRRGREGRERPLCGCAPQAEGQRGSQAAVLACSSWSAQGCQGGFFHALQAAPAWLRSTAAAPGEATFPAERKERQERNQSSVEEREAEEERMREPDRIWLHQWEPWLPSVR